MKASMVSAEAPTNAARGTRVILAKAIDVEPLARANRSAGPGLQVAEVAIAIRKVELRSQVIVQNRMCLH